MILDPEATDLLAKKETEPLARFILEFPDATDDERRGALAALADPDELDWVPFLSLIVIHIVGRRMKWLEERFMHRVVDASTDALVNAISDGNYVKAEANAGVVFNVSEALGNVQEEG